MRQITIRKLDAAGKEQLSYQGALVERGPGWICIDAVFALPRRDLGYVTLCPGDRFREWFYADRWYNIFRVSSADGLSLKGWYCNITRPARITARQVAADDLALDIFVYPDGRSLLLDEAEFQALSLPPRERQCAMNAVSAIQSMIARRQPPFDEIAKAAQAPR